MADVVVKKLKLENWMKLVLKKNCLLTNNHEGKVKPFLNCLPVHLIGQIRKSHIAVELLGLGRYRGPRVDVIVQLSSIGSCRGFFGCFGPVGLSFVAVLRRIDIVRRQYIPRLLRPICDSSRGIVRGWIIRIQGRARRDRRLGWWSRRCRNSARFALKEQLTLWLDLKFLAIFLPLELIIFIRFRKISKYHVTQ